MKFRRYVIVNNSQNLGYNAISHGYKGSQNIMLLLTVMVARCGQTIQAACFRG